jgi:hypothetical protein
MTVGVQDLPIAAKDQKLGLQPYARALGNFIKSCPTPMTIGVQGDWGIGKTSMMKCIQDELGNAAVCRWINTWRLSQFDLGDELSLTFISALIREIEQDEKLSRQAREKVRRFGRFFRNKLGTAAAIAAGAVAKGEAGVEIDHMIRGEETDPVEALEQLRTELVALINKVRLANGPDSRIVVFVDDLDRIKPERAVELLEVMKNFCDVEGVVFVLAIDYEVVRKGLRAKFGDDDRGGKSFFDKIIQVPFRMPAHEYKLDEYVDHIFASGNVKLNEAQRRRLGLFFRETSFSNPRTIKRLFNTYLLLSQVAVEKLAATTSGTGTGRFGEAEALALLGAICLQNHSEEAFNGFLRAKDDAEEFHALFDDEDRVRDFFDEDDPAADAAVDFVDRLGRLLDADGNGKLDASEIELFRSTLGSASVATVDAEAGENSGTRRVSGNRRVDAFIAGLEDQQRRFAIIACRLAEEAGVRVVKAQDERKIRLGDVELKFVKGHFEIVTRLVATDELEAGGTPQTLLLPMEGSDRIDGIKPAGKGKKPVLRLSSDRAGEEALSLGEALLRVALGLPLVSAEAEEPGAGVTDGI